MFKKKTSVSIIKIKNNMIDQRIDNFILSKFYKIPKNMLYKIIRIGRIRVNKKRVKPYYKLKIGDILRIPPLQEKKNSKIIELDKKIKKKLLSSILYEDECLLIINKPSGIAVHGGSGLKFGIIESFRLLKKKNKYLELIHRLDRDTSGILMLAKKKSCLKNMHQQFRDQKIKKKYIALVHGLFKHKKKTVFEPLIKKKKINEKKKVTINKLGKKSVTVFELKKRFSSSSLLSIIPKTGRTHQIRVHAAFMNNPIIFDDYYGNKLLDLKIKKNKKKEKILLHAISIVFHHPKKNKKIYLTAPLGKRFKKYLN